MAKKGEVRLSHLTFTLILEEMLSGPCTAKVLAEHSGMGHRVVCRLLRTMYSKKVVHVSGWDRDALGRFGVKVYALGPGKDAKKPAKPREQVNREYRNRVAQAPLKGTPFYGLMASNDSRKAA